MRRSNFILRSMMYVPGHNEKLLMSAAASSADALILDVEDSVMPFSQKQIARDMIREKVTPGLFRNFKVFARINNRKSGFCLRDVYNLTIEGISGFVYPKVVKGEDIVFMDKLLEAIEYEKGFPVGTFKIVPLIETAAAVLNVQEICLASNRVIAITYECGDFIADLEGVLDPKGTSLYVPRAMIAMGARATGVIPIDTVHVNVHDLEELEENVKLAKTLGFEGMLILHPKELEIAHKYFTPSETEIEDARETLRLYAEAEAKGKGVAVSHGKLIGPPLARLAEKILEKDKQIKQKD